MKQNDWLEFKVKLKERLKEFSLKIIKLIQSLPYRTDTRVIGGTNS